MDWGTSFVHKYMPPEELSDCRMLVMVESGTEYEIRKLIDEFPDVCWKFPCSTTIAQYHFDVAAKNKPIIADKSNPHVSEGIGDLPKFYATLPFFVSPFEINIQPKYLDKARLNMSEQLQRMYEENSQRWKPDPKNIFDTVACACKSGDAWHRARIFECKRGNSFLVDLIDYGVRKIADFENLRMLPKKFGRIPPLALKCRVRDVYVNDLNTEKVDLFSKIIEECGNLVRVEITSVQEPYLVNLFHPTISNYNLCEVFYRRAPDPGHEAAKWRKLKEHERRENGDTSDQEDMLSDEEEEEFSDPLPRFVIQLDRIGKATRVPDKKLQVTHVENARLIYVKSNWQIKQTTEIEEILQEKAICY
ncbi:hypothetical protein WR25_16735 [Diploscapter pachys]|uniref:Tudor domain-containing protein n=1 Tax=Diploscapter pachys TaxID=2018661 RepID=A0A2A2JKY1_9BILA|nr:hypothetical protein WR25_16735 [Diploscapter pachys]